MAFLITMPKSAAKLRPVPMEMPVVDTVEADHLKEKLLSIDARPRDVLEPFGYESLCKLMDLNKIWDVVKSYYDLDHTYYMGDPNPTIRMIHNLLSSGNRPIHLIEGMNLTMVKNLLDLELEWDFIKNSYHPPGIVCAFCGENGAKVRCYGCSRAKSSNDIFYCGKECLKAGWAAHKKTCGKDTEKKNSGHKSSTMDDLRKQVRGSYTGRMRA